MATHNSTAALLRQDNKELRRLAAAQDDAQFPEARLERLERELERHRRAYDALLQRRHHQVDELEQLTSRCMGLSSTSGASNKLQDAAQRQAAQLEIALASTGSQMQCAMHMQDAYQQALEQHKEELQEAEHQAAALKMALQKAQEQLQQAKGRLMCAQAGREAAKHAAMAAEQQLVAGRSSRRSLQALLLQQCHAGCSQLHNPSAAEDGFPTPAVCADDLWEALQGVAALQQPQAAKLLDALQDIPHQQKHLQSQDRGEAEEAAVQGANAHGTAASPVETLQRLLSMTGCTSLQQLLQHVQALVQASASLCEAEQQAVLGTSEH